MTVPAKPQRADAVRNRSKILTAAQQQIADKGPDVGMDEIAQAAGVAVGTLYRHFPTKNDLVAAVVSGYVRAVADDAEASLARARSGARAADEVVEFLRRVTAATADVHSAKAAARSMGLTDYGDQTAEARGGAAIAQLIALAQREGGIRPAITVNDIYILMSTAPTDQTSDIRERWLELVLPGLTTPEDNRL